MMNRKGATGHLKTHIWFCSYTSQILQIFACGIKRVIQNQATIHLVYIKLRFHLKVSCHSLNTVLGLTAGDFERGCTDGFPFPESDS